MEVYFKGNSRVLLREPLIVCCLGFVLEQTSDYVYLELAHVERFIVTKRTEQTEILVLTRLWKCHGKKIKHHNWRNKQSIYN